MKLTLSPKADIREKLVMFILAFLAAPLIASAFCYSCFNFLGIEANEPFKYIMLALSTLMLILVWWCVYTPPVNPNW